MTTPPFAYVSGNPDNLIGGRPAAMGDIQGPFYDVRAYLNSLGPLIDALSPAQQLVTAAPVLDVGVLNQLRAGRQLTLADFTGLGLQAPLGLWNLTDLTDASGNARTLSNKGAVPFGVGINGVAGTAAVFAGSTGQALYIADTGAADPFRIRTGSWGCWFRCAKGVAGATQGLITKSGNNPFRIWGCWLENGAAPACRFQASISLDGTNLINAPGVSGVNDDRWHFGVATFDGTTLRAYVDGALEASVAAAGTLASVATPLNIGGTAADGAVAALDPQYGRVDEAFVTADVLSEDQIRLLYAAKLVHTLGTVPSGARLNVRRRRKGAPLAVTDFQTAPLRLHNFTAGSLNDEGTGGVALTNNGTAVSVAGADGAPGAAYSFAGAQSLSSTDAGLPAGTAARSHGCWLKTATVAQMGLQGWGAVGDARLMTSAAGALQSTNGADIITGPLVTDGQWHQAIAVEDNAAGDGVRRKLYVDGRLVGGSTVLNAITLAGANRFRLGANSDGTLPFTGQIDRAFVTGYALGADEIARFWAKGSQALAASPKNVGDHVEALLSDGVLFIGDTLESQHTIDLGVLA